MRRASTKADVSAPGRKIVNMASEFTSGALMIGKLSKALAMTCDARRLSKIASVCPSVAVLMEPHGGRPVIGGVTAVHCRGPVRLMLNSIIARVVDTCVRHAWIVIAVSLVLGGGSSWYASRHFALNTDISKLLSSRLPWRQRELDFKTAFPQEAQGIIAVVQGPTPEFADAAAKALVDRLRQRTSLFRSVQIAGGGEFFDRNALLYLSTNDLAHTTEQLGNATPMLQVLAGDPSLRGLGQALSIGLQGVDAGRYSLDDLARPLNMAADTFEDVLSGRPASFSWHALLTAKPARPEELTRLVEIWPVLDYRALEPGKAATTAIRAAAKDAKLDSAFASTVQLTGPVPIADQEFATLRQGLAINAVITAAIVLVILWLALRSLRIVAAVVVCVLVGLAITAAVGLLLVGALNPISAAFVVLFVGLGADFAIQFSVRYRAERHADDDVGRSLVSAARRVGAPLTLAAAAAAAGFLSFLPTSYRGLAELGLIAGSGMLVAYVASMTLLPALLRRFNPPPETQALGYTALAPVDRFLRRYRILVVAGTVIVALAGLPLLMQLQFDFSPMDLQPPNSEAIATLHLLRHDPRVSTDAAEVLVQRADAAAVSKRLSALPQVARTRQLDDFIPQQQDDKLALIHNVAGSIESALQVPRKPAPSDAEELAALAGAATKLREAIGEASGAGAEAASRLADDLTAFGQVDSALRASAEAAFVRPLEIDLAQLRQALRPQHVVRTDLPGDLVHDWVTPDGRARIEAAPRGDLNDSETLRSFASAVLAVQPNATGQAIETYEWGNTIIGAFLQAGAWALCSIALLLFIVLRRVRDVLLTLVPLMVAATVTLEICALAGFSLNYANIIALPVLLGIGVAFKIYYVMAWRRGETAFLQSSLTHAVFFSALMTATAFGSLWLSDNPGMSSMGQLLALSLICTLASAALFQPALMGPPRGMKPDIRSSGTV
jgi:uncharacterized protein